MIAFSALFVLFIWRIFCRRRYTAGWMVGGDSDDKAPDHQSQASTRPGNAQGRRESTECILVTLPHQENIELHRVLCGNCGDIYTGALSV